MLPAYLSPEEMANLINMYKEQEKASLPLTTEEFDNIYDIINYRKY